MQPMKHNLFVVETGNQYGQILIFEDKEEAREWLKRATYWNDEEIERNIFTARRPFQGATYCNYFPQTEEA